MASPTPRLIAWHEAGHAVVAWDQGFTVTSVSIQRKGNSPGRCDFIPLIDWADRSERARGNIVYMAGWAAEHASKEASDSTYDGDDLTQLLNHVHQYDPSRVAIDLGHAEREAERIVSANLDRIERLVSELIRRIELTDAAEILKLIEGQAA